MKKKAIVCDIDGVVLDTQFILDEIHELGLKGEEKWEYFYENCNSDRVKAIETTKNFYTTIRYEINDLWCISSTARNEKCSDATLKKLAREKIVFDRSYWRKDGDLRPACEVKREYLLQIMEEFDVIAFIDDDLQNCKMAKSLGILSLRRV